MKPPFRSRYGLCAAALTLALSSLAAHAAPPLPDRPGQAAEFNRQTANAWLEIDVAAFEQNIATLQKLLDGKSQICAIMKADAYGNGIDLLMPSVIRAGIPCIGITSNDEAQLVRAHGFKGRLTRVRAASLDEMRDGLAYDMEELLGDREQAEAASKLAQEAGKTLRFHLALNSSGMNRNGLDMDEDGRKAALDIVRLPGLQITGIMTHFAVEDADDVRKGLKRFNEESAWIIENGKLDRKKLTLHAANSFTTLSVPEARLDMVRPGGLLYGDTIPSHTEYRKIMSFKTRVASVNDYPKGSTVGYDRTHTLKRDSLLANLPMGYSDGYRRVFTNKGHVLIRGHRVPVVGKVSMNTTMVDVTDFPDIRPGDEVVIFGSQEGAEITQAEIEEINDALLADLYTVWGNSNPRVAKKVDDSAAAGKSDADAVQKR